MIFLFKDEVDHQKRSVGTQTLVEKSFLKK